MSLFTDTVTLYNYVRDHGTEEESWQRTVLKGVQWRDKVSQVVDNEGKLHITKTVSITIPDELTHNYITPEEFPNVPDRDKEDYYTLNTVDNLDIAILGEVSREIEGSYRLKDLRRDYRTVTVKSVSDNRNRDYLKHIKVVCE